MAGAAALSPVLDAPRAVEAAPDGLTVELLVRHARASTARFVLPAGAVGRAIKHREVTEVWTVIAGRGRLWRRLGSNGRDRSERVDGEWAGSERVDDGRGHDGRGHDGRGHDGRGHGGRPEVSGPAEDVARLAPGVTAMIPPDACFQVRADGDQPLLVFACTTPPWPGDHEARRVAGRWTPTLRAITAEGPVALRPAVDADRARLDALALRSKAWWGYSESFLTACEDELTVRDRMVAHTVVAECDAQCVGFATVLEDRDGAASLELFFVEPDWMGRGVGRRLFDAALAHARALGCVRLEIEADPGAEPFYRACGARRVGQRPSASIADRALPFLVVDIELAR